MIDVNRETAVIEKHILNEEDQSKNYNYHELVTPG